MSTSSERIEAALASQRRETERKRYIAERQAAEQAQRDAAAKKEAANAKRREAAAAKRAKK